MIGIGASHLVRPFDASAQVDHTSRLNPTLDNLLAPASFKTPDYVLAVPESSLNDSCSCKEFYVARF